MKKLALPILIFVMGLLYIFVIPNEPEALKTLFKLIPMWLILIYAYIRIPDKTSRPHWIIWSGLFFCMLGDGLLRWFVIGLTAFLIGHIFYAVGFSRYRQVSKQSLLLLIPIGLYGFVMGFSVIDALLADQNYALLVPVLIYLMVILLMCWTSFLSKNKWAMIGSVLFVISDSFLSWNMFVSDILYSDILIMTTYYSAQFLIAHSLRFFKPYP
ncbi:lysoplasmalogenase [Robertmurraya kyonggiensis]|nr:lysoplasmalogenase [Robertmurraya kyonggiensis]